MGRQNIAFLYARVAKDPNIQINKETGEYQLGMVYLDVVRGKREIDDKVNFVKHDKPMVVTRERDLIEDIATWKENNIVLVKGVLTTSKIAKPSYCTHCTDENGSPTKNITDGNFVYVTPIFVQKIMDCDSKAEAIEEITKKREISNQIYILGTVLKDPKLITTKQGVQFTQYPIAINRKFIIRTDDPDIRTDWPIVKSYGEQARDDKTYLRYQAEVIIDGFLQARTVRRKRKCDCCGEIYTWQDKALELVPYDVEYVSGHKTKEEAEAEYEHTVEEYKQMLYDSQYKDIIDDDLRSEDVDS